jgi:hypothetical protein
MMVPRFEGFTFDDDGFLRFKNQIYVSSNDELRIIHGSPRSCEEDGEP